MVNVVLGAAVLSVICAATLTLSRNLVTMVVCGLAILYVSRKVLGGQVNFKFLFSAVSMLAGGVVLLFFAFSFLRGTSDWDYQVHNLFGYTVVYNRLAAILSGRLRYPFGGRGLYLSSFLAFSHMFNRIIPMAELMHWPDFQEVWGAEFVAIDRAGLDGGGIWSGAFGYIFSDLGGSRCRSVWLRNLVRPCLELDQAWEGFRNCSLSGRRVLCTVLVRDNFLFDSRMAYLLAFAIILMGYEHVLVSNPILAPGRKERWEFPSSVTFCFRSLGGGCF